MCITPTILGNDQINFPKTKTEQLKKEFEEIIKAPKVLKEFKGQTCFVCGQPYNKSPQVEKLWQFIEQALKESLEEVIKAMLVEERESFIEKINDYLIAHVI